MSIYLTTFLVSLGISTALGVIIVIADKLLSNYGECTITINDDKQVVVEGGNSLMSSLFEKKYFIPSACGGKGTCGYCMVKLPDEDIPLLPTEEIVMAEKDVNAGWRLACQIKVKKNMSVWMPEEYFMIKEFHCRVAKTETIAADIKEIELEMIEPDSIEFKAGQYIQVMVPSVGETVYRSYSISSHPGNCKSLFLNIKLEDKGIGSTYLHKLKVGDTVNISGPYGDFLLTGSNRQAVFVAGGVGLAPINSILHQIFQDNIDRKCLVYFKVKLEEEFYYLEQLSQWKEKYANFSYKLVVSDIPETESFDSGERARITKVLEDDFQKISESEFYLCGAPKMINGIMEYFDKKGIPSDRVFYDKFE
ncbi:2Fe-2S iron-sulfur cluster binding domain-containing protein [bacterium]|nr:2Fe-2S iron-sulfur cluster binding domain-containing protein [bacterium]